MTAKRQQHRGDYQCQGGCGRWLTYGGRGQPPKWCDDCNPRRIRPERECIAPGCTTIIPRGSKRLACSPACYMRAYRQRAGTTVNVAVMGMQKIGRACRDAGEAIEKAGKVASMRPQQPETGSAGERQEPEF